MGYQERDRHIIDYDLYDLPGVAPHPGGGRFRGPQVRSSRYIACVGAAQTFGCFVWRPFPVLLSQRLGIETLNLGAGGAGPTFHVANSRLMEYINSSQLVVVQILSGRSQSNSLFRTTHHGMDGVNSLDGRRMIAQEFYAEMLERRPQDVPALVSETRERYVEAMATLLRSITPPKVLLWVSTRTPEYKESYELPIWKLWGAFPQFVNRSMVDELRHQADAYVECVTSRGLPQPLFDLEGRPTNVRHGYTLLKEEIVIDTHNRYYPSPEMHEDVAEMLAPVCADFLGPASGSQHAPVVRRDSVLDELDLSTEDVDFFLSNGFVRIPSCFSRGVANALVVRAFERLGFNRKAPSTWTTDRVRLPSTQSMDFASFAPRAWRAACRLLGGAERIGPGYVWDSFIMNLRFDAERPWVGPSALAKGWHKEGDSFRHFLDSPEQALVALISLTDTEHRGGGTYIARDSVSVVARYFATRPEGVLPHKIDYPALLSECREFEELTARAGDIILMHPYMLHASSQNHSGQVRIALNPPISLRSPMKFLRQDRAYSPVERAVLRGLGVEDFAFAPSGSRERVVPKRAAEAELMRFHEQQRKSGADDQIA